MPGLLSTITIKQKQFRNRIVMPPLYSELAMDDGGITVEHFDYYTKRARAGVGLIIVEHSFVDPEGRAGEKQVGIHNDIMVGGLNKLANAIKDTGAVAVIQISHAGSNTKVVEFPKGPSPIPHPNSGIVPKEMGCEEMKNIRKAFAMAALRAKNAGFDGVEVHGAHGYVLNQFFSPITNTRTDEYGGNVENRMRFPIEVVKAVREAVGEKYLVLYRLGADDKMEGGLTIEDSKLFAGELQNYVDIIDVSGGLRGGRWDGMTPGVFVPLSAAIKITVNVPVIVTGRITEPKMADQIIREGKADFVGIGRAQLRDENWAKKAIEDLSFI
jgi:NADPH2 dehydrogenase